MKAPIRSTVAVLATAAVLTLAGCAGGAQAGFTDERSTPTVAPSPTSSSVATPLPPDSLPMGRRVIKDVAPLPDPEKLPPGQFAKRPQ